MPSLRAVIESRHEPGASQFTQATRRMAEGARKADREIRLAERGTKELGQVSSTVSRQVAGLFGAFSATIVVRQATKLIAGFGETMATIQGVANIPSELDERFQRLEQTARKLGATTRYTAQEAASGLLALTRAGFSAEEAVQAIASTLDLATAGGIGLAEATESRRHRSGNSASTRPKRVASRTCSSIPRTARTRRSSSLARR